MADAPYTIPAISEITDIQKIRVVLFINNQLVHAPAMSLFAALTERLNDLETRVAILEQGN